MHNIVQTFINSIQRFSLIYKTGIRHREICLRITATLDVALVVAGNLSNNCTAVHPIQNVLLQTHSVAPTCRFHIKQLPQKCKVTTMQGLTTFRYNKKVS